MISSTVQTSIVQFIETKKKQGYSLPAIKKQLVLHGYTESEINAVTNNNRVNTLKTTTQNTANTNTTDSNLLLIIQKIKTQRSHKKVDSQIRSSLKKEGFTTNQLNQAFHVLDVHPLNKSVQNSSKNISKEVSKSKQLLERIHQNERDALMHKIKVKLAGKRHFFSGISQKKDMKDTDEDSQNEKMQKALQEALEKSDSSESRLNELQNVVSNMSSSMASEVLGKLEQSNLANTLAQSEQKTPSQNQKQKNNSVSYVQDAAPVIYEEQSSHSNDEFAEDHKRNKEVVKLSSEYKNPRLQNDKPVSRSSGGEGFGYYNPIVADKLEFTKEPIGDRAQTGIPDLDLVIDGGFVRDSVTLVSGGAGTGKSTFALQYIINGIVLHNEPGIYVTFEQTREAIIQLGKQFGWDIENLEKQNMLTIHEYSPEQIYKAVKSGGGSFRDLVDSISAKRLVVDSITEYVMMFETVMSKRREITDFFKTLTKWGVSVLVVGEEESTQNSHKSTVLDYECDGVILLYNERKGDIRQRALEIFKMRGTKHAGRIFPMKITNTGVLVNVKSGQIYRG